MNFLMNYFLPSSPASSHQQAAENVDDEEEEEENQDDDAILQEEGLIESPSHQMIEGFVPLPLCSL